jgi:hypothetical protein
VLAKDLKRGQVPSFFEKLEQRRVGPEACASAHHWARELVELGHDVKLISAQRVKAFLPRMKNDAQDAKAIARALRDPEMRFVSVKSVEKQVFLMLFKARDLLMGQRTGLINAIRGHFGEIGIVVPQGAHEIKALVQMVLQDDQQMRLPELMRHALQALVTSLSNLETEIKVLNVAIAKQHKASEQSHNEVRLGFLFATERMKVLGDIGHDTAQKRIVLAMQFFPTVENFDVIIEGFLIFPGFMQHIAQVLARTEALVFSKYGCQFHRLYAQSIMRCGFCIFTQVLQVICKHVMGSCSSLSWQWRRAFNSKSFATGFNHIFGFAAFAFDQPNHEQTVAQGIGCVVSRFSALN